MSGPAVLSSTLLSLRSPLTRQALDTLRTALASNDAPSRHPVSDVNGINASTGKQGQAAVLLPLCNVNNIPGIILEVRAKSLRSHSGEISFPGGRIDDEDATFLDGALRETQEELGVPRENVEIIGKLWPAELNLRGNMRVWPYVGFVHPEHRENALSLRPDEPLPSVNLASLRKDRSQDEVAAVFQLPLSELVSPKRLLPHKFRDKAQYWAIDVTDLVHEADPESVPLEAASAESLPDEVGNGRGERILVWGLTGWYLSLFRDRLDTLAMSDR
ncbi:hypothetical protein HGRIS_004742 [Hohenbuehelia grisea]|uniref:Nudix hydrolase domain-containing protein n=1 Tax=Hohenbuehelia grisea TaxID=104357 RepID=A0ABR3JDM2_9AGAR